jgi:hypothetical protein
MTHKPNRFSIFTQLQGIMSASFATGLIYHPLDVMVRRWQRSTLTLKQAKSDPAGLRTVIFQQAANGTGFHKLASVFQGFPIGITYKCVLLTYVMVCESAIVNLVKASRLNQVYQTALGSNYALAATHATAGALVGLGETVFLPLEILKTQYVTNPVVRQTIKTSGLGYYLAQEKRFFYKTAPIAALKYSLGLSVFFGIDSAVKCSYASEQLTRSQVLMAASTGAVANIVLTTPLDVIKVRAESTVGPVSIIGIVKETLKNEKPSAFFRSLAPKLFFKGGKLALTFGGAEIFYEQFKQTQKKISK